MPSKTKKNVLRPNKDEDKLRDKRLADKSHIQPQSPKNTNNNLPHFTKRQRQSPYKTDSLYVEGESSIIDYLKLSPHLITRVYYKKNISTECENLAKKNAIEVIHLAISDMKEEYPRAPVFAKIKIKPLDEKIFIQDLGHLNKDIIIICDHITDPRNMGAIIRSAAFFGVKSIAVPEMRQAGITQAMINTAQGGFATTRLVAVKNIARFIEDLKERGYWIVVADMSGEDLTPQSINFDKVVLVLGSESLGVSRLVKKISDLSLRIPSMPGVSTIDSLNVAVASGIFCYCWQQAQSL